VKSIGPQTGVKTLSACPNWGDNFHFHFLCPIWAAFSFTFRPVPTLFRLFWAAFQTLRLLGN